MNKIVFYLMNEKGLHVLNDFLNKFNSDVIEYIVLSKDENIEKDYFDEIREICQSNGIKFFYRKDNIPSFSGYKFTIGWRWIIENTNNLIVLHDSILPKYRGFSPLVNMLINGEKVLGVTALFASNKYDEGYIIKQERVSIEYPIKIKDAIEHISPLYSKLVNEIVDLIIVDETIVGFPQKKEEASYSVWRDEKDYFINWSKDSSSIRRTIDALGFPYSGARTLLNGEVIIIDEVEEYPDVIIENRDIGKVIFIEKNFPVVICGEGLLKIIRARDLNKKFVIPLNKFRSRFGGQI